MKKIGKSAAIVLAIIAGYYAIQLALDSSKGMTVIFVLAGALLLCAGCIIFWLTRAYYGAPALSPSTAEGPMPAGFLRGRKKITLKELSVIWKPQTTGQREKQPATGAKAVLSAATVAVARAQEVIPEARPAVGATQAAVEPPVPEPASPEGAGLPWGEQPAPESEATPVSVGEAVRQEDSEDADTMASGFAAETPSQMSAPAPAPVPESEPAKGLEFKHELVVDYYNEKIATKVRGFMQESVRLRVVESILKILDTHGDCPSVVDAIGQYGEPNSDLKRTKARADGESLFDVLGGVTLLEHSLNVARRIELARDGSTQAPLYIIEALAHDLGKIPAYRQGHRSYVTGDHPIIACNILQAEVDGFMELPEKDRRDIEGAVRYHHREAFQIGDLDMDHLRLLQKADREARSAEMANRLHGAAPTSDYFKATPRRQPGQPKLADEEQTAKATQVEEAFRAFDDMDLSWLDTAVFFRKLMPYINDVQNGCYKAVSTPDGYVYVWGDLLSQVMNEVAIEAGQPEVVASDVNQQGRWRKLRSIMRKLRKDGFVAAHLIHKDYFTAPFLVTHSDGRQDELSAAPFVVEAFGVNPSDLEVLKRDTLVRNITSITVDRRPKAERKERGDGQGN